jgi:aryl-alcohol dehydrogenase-like predicted oxidoreductase
MEYRRLGRSEGKVSAVALGAWAIGGWLWGGMDDAKAVAGIQKAIDLGMTTIDTAAVYGFGHSEEIVGRAIAGRRDKIQILTKFGLRWDLAKGTQYFDTTRPDGQPVRLYKYGGAESVAEECEQSLRRLGVEAIDLYQHHWPDPSTPVEETMEACAKLLKAGKIRAVGVSNYSPELMERAQRVVPLASDQPPYSMVRRGVEADVLPWCIEHKVGVLVYSPLQNGILSGRVTMDREFPPDDLRSRNPYYKKENRRRILGFLEKIRPIAETHGASLAQLVINWTIHRPGVTAALVGVRNPQQAEENARAAAFRLTAEETSEINARLNALELEL